MDIPYRSRPIHVYTLCLPLLLLGATGMGLGGKFWLVGLIVFLLGILTGTWIVGKGWLQAHSEWMEEKAYSGRIIMQTMQQLQRIKDPNVWEAMGYTLPTPETVQIEEPVTKDNPYRQTSFPTPPATTPQMKLLSNDVLRGGSMSENRWQGKGRTFPGKKFTRLMEWMEHPNRRYARFINPSFPKQGRTLTKRGVEFLLFYADEELKQMFQQKGRDGVMLNAGIVGELMEGG